MKREWQPGDVAAITFNNAASGARLRGQRDIVTRTAVRGKGWWAMGKGSGLTDEQIADADLEAIVRPLVVIDPEDAGQIDRLVDAILDHGYQFDGQRVADLAAALRSLVAPPKPEEPTGLGAVVEDIEGRRWVRVANGEDSTADNWQPIRIGQVFDSDAHWTFWKAIDAVRVLSEGVVQP